MPEINKASLRDSILHSIGNFLYEEGFEKDDITKHGLLEILNLISDYHEEGSALFPEILVTNNLDFFKTIPNKEIIIRESDLSIKEFKNAVKLCAPLATNNWIIFIEVKKSKIKYGLTSAEMTATSPSMYNQTVGQLKVEEYKDITLAYIRNIGQKTVELVGLKTQLIVSLTLNEPREIGLSEIQTLSKAITTSCEVKLRNNISTFFEKLIDEALKTSHGNLIGIIDDCESEISRLKSEIKGEQGIYLIEPIDFESLILESETNNNNESSINLKSYSTLLKAMLNHDGITIISNKARVIGYHILISDLIKSTDNVVGGARSRAFKSMENCGLFLVTFYKSQDGDLRIWQKK